MAKRLSDTQIWKNQRWFRKLNPLYKLIFLYIKDQCNHAGIWKMDCSDLMEDIGIDSFDINDFLLEINTDFDKRNGKKELKNRIVIVNENILWITGFIQFQYENKEGVVSELAAPVKTALQILNGIKSTINLINKNTEPLTTLTEPLTTLTEPLTTLTEPLTTLTEPLTLLAQGLAKGYMVLGEGLRKGYVRAKDKDKDKDILTSTGDNSLNSENFKKNKNTEETGFDLIERKLKMGKYADKNEEK